MRRKQFFLCQEFSIDENAVCHHESHFNQFFESFTVVSIILWWVKKCEEFIEQKRNWLKSHVDVGLFLGAIKRFHEVKNRNLTSLQTIISINEWHSPSHFVFHSATPTQSQMSRTTEMPMSSRLETRFSATYSFLRLLRLSSVMIGHQVWTYLMQIVSREMKKKTEKSSRIAIRRLTEKKIKITYMKNELIRRFC